MSQDPPDGAAEGREAASRAQRGRHELPTNSPRPEIGPVRRTGLSGLVRGGRSRMAFGTLAALLCLLLGIAIVTQVRQNESGDSLETARPADLLVLLDSLRQREATLNAEVNELQNTLNSLQASGNNDQAAIAAAQARLAALSILAGAVGPPGRASPSRSTTRGPGRTGGHARRGQRTAGRRRRGDRDQRCAPVGAGRRGHLGGGHARLADHRRQDAVAPYSILAIGDPPTLAAAMNIPGGAEDSIKRVGARMSVRQDDRVDVTTLRQPKPHQYAQPVK